MSETRSVTLRAFAGAHGLKIVQARHLAKTGRIVGAQRLRNGSWVVYPPAVLSERPRAYNRAAEQAACAGGFPAQEAGLSGDTTGAPAGAQTGAGVCAGLGIPGGGGSPALPGQHSGTSFFPVDPPFLGVADDLPQEGEYAGLVYRSPAVQRCCLTLRRVSARINRDRHYLRLDTDELAQVYRAVSRARRKARQGVGKGREKIGALRATDSLWNKLQSAMQRCQRGAL